MESISLKAALTETLGKIMEKHKNAVLITADFVETMGLDELVTKHKERHFSFGGALQAAVSAAAGFTVRGKAPILATVASSLHGASKQLRDVICSPNLNVKLIGGYAGSSMAGDGEGFACFDDLSVMSAFPNMKIICPADYYELASAMEVMFLDYGPAYIRLPGPEIPLLFDESYEFDFAEGCVLREDEGLCIFSMGAAMGKIMELDVDAEMVNLSSLKPLDKDLVLQCARKAKRVVVVEDHRVAGGLGSAVENLLKNEKEIELELLGSDRLDQLEDIIANRFG